MPEFYVDLALSILFAVLKERKLVDKYRRALVKLQGNLEFALMSTGKPE